MPEHVKADYYCSVLLTNLRIVASVMRQVLNKILGRCACSVFKMMSSQEGPKQMSKKKLIKVLGSLKPWELKAPLVAATVKVTE